MHFRLDYPHVNCTQCRENYEIDGVTPDCEHCEFLNLTAENVRALEMHSLAAGGGEVQGGILRLAFETMGIRGAARLRYLRKVALIQHLIQEHYRPKTPTN